MSDREDPLQQKFELSGGCFNTSFSVLACDNFETLKPESLFFCNTAAREIGREQSVLTRGSIVAVPPCEDLEGSGATYGTNVTCIPGGIREREYAVDTPKARVIHSHIPDEIALLCSLHLWYRLLKTFSETVLMWFCSRQVSLIRWWSVLTQLV